MSNFSAIVYYTENKLNCIQCNYDDCASTLKQQSVGRLVALLGHIILIQSQPVFAVSSQCCVFSGEAGKSNFIVFGLSNEKPHFTRLIAIGSVEFMHFGVTDKKLLKPEELASI